MNGRLNECPGLLSRLGPNPKSRPPCQAWSRSLSAVENSVLLRGHPSPVLSGLCLCPTQQHGVCGGQSQSLFPCSSRKHFLNTSGSRPSGIFSGGPWSTEQRGDGD